MRHPEFLVEAEYQWGNWLGRVSLAGVTVLLLPGLNAETQEAAETITELVLADRLSKLLEDPARGWDR